MTRSFRLNPGLGRLAAPAAAFLLMACGNPAHNADGAPKPALPASVDEGNSVEIACNPSSDVGGLSVIVQPVIPAVPVFAQGTGGHLAAAQCGFDVFSWNSFLALSHAPDGSFGAKHGDNPTVWESWPEAGDIFLPGGAAPANWPVAGTPPTAAPPAACTTAREPSMRVLRQIAKRPDVLEEAGEPFDSGPLIDTHGNYARFEITVNQDMYQYLVTNHLYSQAGQQAFSDAGGIASFPCGCVVAKSVSPPPDQDTFQLVHDCPTGTELGRGEQGQIGAIMVKASWKILDTAAGDDPASFHTEQALVITTQPDGTETCDKQLVGLVGLHIAHKTQAAPQWIWSTFEHRANAPERGEAIGDCRGENCYNFFIPGCEDCNAVNIAPPQPWNPADQPVMADAGKSQVMRAIPLTDATKRLNAAVQGILGGTVWVNYQLVSTQWPTDASGSDTTAPSAENGWCAALDPTDKSGLPAPTFLANTTLETYIQGTVPQASSTCINCHLNATMTAAATENFSDFTYLLERAQ